MKIRLIKIIGSVILILGIILIYLYEKGYIGSGINLVTELTSKKISNPYNGIYYYDISKITNTKILKSVNTERENGYNPLTLSINDSGASLLGYQLNSRIRNRFFIVCLSEDNIVLNNGEFGVFNSDYCKIPRGNEFTLKLKSISDNILFCENCETEEFPSYWIKK